jgi:hypothetical protein
LEKCNKITEKVPYNIKKVVKTGTFDNKSNNSSSSSTGASKNPGGKRPNKQKRGTEIAIVNQEDDNEGTEIKDGGFPT